MLRDAVIAVSLSNLLFFNVWRFFLITQSYAYPYYHWKANPAPILLATMLDIILLSAVMWLALTFARRSNKTILLKAARVIFLILFYVAVIDILLRIIISDEFRLFIATLIYRPHLLFKGPLRASVSLWLRTFGLIVGFALAVILFHRLIFRRKNLVRLATALLLIVSPFVLFTFGQGISQWIRFRSGSEFQENTAAKLPPKTLPQRRVVWIVFDEMDYRLSFLERPSTVQLPAFDRLRQEAFFAQNAYPPGGDTVLSMPSLVTGELVAWSHRTAPNELMLTLADTNQTVPWSAQPNAFSKARAMGFNTALAGWYHPYCRIIGSSLTSCTWETYAVQFVLDEALTDLIARSKEVSLGASMLRIAELVVTPDFVRGFLAFRQGRTSRKYGSENYLEIHSQARTFVSDPTLQLILIHYPVPHPPGIYDRARREFSFESSSDYLDNLALADRTVAEIRERMERAGLWESTTVLISSDHHLRTKMWRQTVMWQERFTKVDPVVFNSISDERVPFILKMAGEKTAAEFETTFNTVLSSDLILAIFSGELSRADEVAAWLNKHRSIGQSPYLEGEK